MMDLSLIGNEWVRHGTAILFKDHICVDSKEQQNGCVTSLAVYN